ncbi:MULTISPECIES: glycosyltransferase [unclassified Clostridioides]|uniref:glycosyltransferase n=1 Tax=unclassified Clostridioides TaxID=2635829 RepID=UPI0038A12158
MIIDIVLAYANGRGGLEEVITSISNELINKGYRVRVFQAYEPKYIEWKNTIPEMYIYGINSNIEEDDEFSLALGYRRIIDTIGIPDIIIATHAPILSLISNIAVMHLGDSKPSIISWIHGAPEYYGGGENLNYSNAHLAISEHIEEKIKSYVKGQVYYVGNPVDIDSFDIISSNKEKLELVYIGRLENNQKRIDILFKALSLLDKPWMMRIIGNGPDEKKLKNLSKDLNIDDCIEWYGWLDKPWDYIESVTALVLTSDEEGFGLVLVEALGRGIPVISSKCDGPKDIIKNGINGWLFDKNNYSELYSILNDLQQGRIKIPSKNVCINSVNKFKVKNVVDRFESIVLKFSDKKDVIIKKIKNLLHEDNIEYALEIVQYYDDRFKNDVEFINLKSILAINMKDYDIAISNLEYSLHISDEISLDIYYNLAYAYEQVNRIDDAIKIYGKIIHISSNREKDKLINKINLLLEKNNNYDDIFVKGEQDYNSLISVIIPTYNREQTIYRSVNSVLNQTYKNIEVIIVDDNSSDNTQKIIEYIDDKRIRYIKHNENLGANVARNTGILNSMGEYIAFQDSDDEWMPDKLETQIKYLENIGVDIIGCSSYIDNNELSGVFPGRNINKEIILYELMCGNFIGTSTMFGRRECFEKQKFDEHLPRFQDWDLIIRMAINYKVSFVDKVLVKTYVQSDSISKQPQKAIQAFVIMTNKYEHMIKEDKNILYNWYRLLLYHSLETLL